MKNKLSDLRNHLFEIIEELKDKDTLQHEEREAPYIERVKAICNASQILVNSAKVELEYIKTVGKSDQSTKFFE